MKGMGMEKVPGGKLLIVKTEFDKKINSVQILGDFFAHPEESIDVFEKMIVGLQIDFDESELRRRLTKVVNEKKYELIGLTADSIVDVLKKSLEVKS